MFSKLLSRNKKEEKSDADALIDFADASTTDKTPDPFHVTEAAADKIKSLVKEEPKATGLRIFVQGGGCSGFQYGFAFAEELDADDTNVEAHGASVVVDAMSYQYVMGAEIDYKDDLQGSTFVIRNPQATATCGCGSSFAYG
jgi:iron-sulfur cluster insertion protein|tara:strand:- start:61 stop:486 length:426 start_codon:yes stop_codon:yes gene_type:complete